MGVDRVHRFLSRLLHGAVAVAGLTQAALAEPATHAERVARVFVLAGQSNMEGQAVVDLAGPDYNDGRGTLETLLRDPAHSIRWAHLRNADGSWRSRDDVFVRYQREGEPLLAGPLGIGYTVYGGRHHFGAELEFGHVMGDFCSRSGESVLLVKTAWGGKSLYGDFRPPSAGATTDADGNDVPAPGPFYSLMIEQVREAVAAAPDLMPGVVRGELAGFVWWHGWNDGCDERRAAAAYAENLAAFIRDVRRDLDSPHLPVVIGELTGPWKDAPGAWGEVRRSQAAVAALPEFRDDVRFVSTREFVRPSEESPNPEHGHHEFGNADTYLLVGEALGQAMVNLLSKPTR